MSIEEKTLSQEEVKSQGESLKEKKTALAEDILGDMDLTTNVQEVKDRDDDQTETIDESEQTVDETETDEEQVSASEEEEEEEDEVEDELSEVERLKATFQKRIDQLTSKIKALESEGDKLKDKAGEDPDLAKLEQMPSEELKRLKRQVRIEAVKSNDDEARLNELLDLEDKIETVIQSAPKKFEQKQIKNFQSAVTESISEGVVPNDESVIKKVMLQAKEIYSEFPELQKSEKGQAHAWKMAIRMSKAEPKSNDSELRLKRENNKLKKKTALSTGKKKGDQRKSDMAKMQKNAKSGDSFAKAKYLRQALDTDSLIPDEFKE